MSDVRTKRRADALRAEIAARRHRLEVDAEAVAFRTDVKARAKDALEDGKERLIATIAQTFDTARDSLANAAATAQTGAKDLGERVGAQVADVAHEAAERLAPIATAAATVAHDAVVAASDAIETGKEAIAHHETPPAIEITGA